MCLGIFSWFVGTGSHSEAALAGLELPVYTRLTLNSHQSASLMSPKPWDPENELQCLARGHVCPCVF